MPTLHIKCKDSGYFICNCKKWVHDIKVFREALKKIQEFGSDNCSCFDIATKALKQRGL